MQFLKTTWGILLVPVLALAYGAHALWELTTGPFHNATIIYTYVIAIPMLILGAIAVAGDLRNPAKASEPAEAAASGDDREDVVKGGGRRVALVVLISLALISVLSWVGYLIAFFLFVLAVLWAVELRNWVAGVVIAVIMTAVVHFIFVLVLGQDLPVGILTFMAR
ncbi:MAG: tripartite tricarboxylate transporter TctB family protein [Alphaproteobacteria bacterium]|nr:tripartite tricarboxylate transporter TctB family protein [Alphaproteobacteria bacterium]MCZ6742313.1 tripartite tricarboxylate transporter TctB family protein [Alphaproteobacteria bacterium]MCZ6814871.1 tripartite tricarboxylate transporter TctB family protein [Alphaproteobacteria bacterium]MCZ6849296.1 tripartite tricarboxylate transporter TctB family protein [Alphaproteobacteria bacterium]